MSAATLFEGGKVSGTSNGNGRRGSLVSLLTGGFGAAEEVPQVQVPHRHTGQLAMRDYLRGVEQMIQRSDHAQINETLVEVTPKEVQALVEKSSKAKARYLAAALELTEMEGLPESNQVKNLEQARERYEAMQASVNALLSELKRGHVRVAGVAPDFAADSDDEQ